jgi:hypothetical protein
MARAEPNCGNRGTLPIAVGQQMDVFIDAATSKASIPTRDSTGR